MSDSEEEFASADEGDTEVGSSSQQSNKGPTGQSGKKDSKSVAKSPGGQSGKGKDSASQSDSRTQQVSKAPAQSQKPGAGSNPKQTASASSVEKDDKGVVGKEKSVPVQQQTTGKGKKGRKGKGAKRATEKPHGIERTTEPAALEKAEIASTEQKTDISEVVIESTAMDAMSKDEGSEVSQETVSQPVEEPIAGQQSNNENILAEETGEAKAMPEPIETESATVTSEGNGGAKPVEEPPQSTSPRDGAKSIFDKLAGVTLKEDKGEKSSSSWGGSWGGWGKSLLSTASSSVSTFTSQVGEGFSTVLETVEASLGAPSPEELAKKESTAEEAVKEEDSANTKQEVGENKQPVDAEETAAETTNDEKAKGDAADVSATEGSQEQDPPKQDEAPTETESGAGGLGGWFSSFGKVTKKLEDTGKNIMTGGLDVLESIGKKTMDVISEKDPGFAHTKGLFKDKGSKPNLSQILREAKEEAEENAKLEEEHKEAQKAHFGTLFDEHQGLARLEALEMLSNQSEAKVQGMLGSLSEDQLQSIKLELVMIKEAFQLEDFDEPEDDETDHNFTRLMTEHLLVVHPGTTPDKLNKVQSRIREYLKDCKEELQSGTKQSAKDMHCTAIQSLAELTSAAVGQFHKAGELLLLQKDDGSTFADRASSLSNLTRVLCTEVGILSNKFTQCMNATAADAEDPDSVNPLITNVYLEAGNSATYIQDAFQLLLPVMQMAALQNQATEN